MRRGALIVLVLAMLGAAAWTLRESVLTAVGRMVVEEDPPRPVQLGAVLMSDPILGAVEMARLMDGHYVPRIVIFTARFPSDDVLDQLHVDAPRPHDLAVMVLRRLGVPDDHISVEVLADNGTNASVRALAQYMRRHGIDDVAVVVDRSHTRRVAWLLRDLLSRKSVVVVRAAAADTYRPESWWKDRSSTRELMEESLRWFNSFVLRDWWRGTGVRRDGAVPESAPRRHALQT